MLLAGLSSGHKIGLAVVAVVFIAFALASSFLAPRRRPDFPGKNGLSVFIIASFVLFAAMLAAVEAFGGESEEKPAKQAKPAKTGKSNKKDDKKHDKKKEDADDGSDAPSGNVKLYLRLAFSGHEKMTEDRSLKKFPSEGPFNELSSKAVKDGDAEFAALEKKFESLE